MYMMFNFIAGAIATTVYGKLLDQPGADAPWNPLLINQHAALFSNIFFVLTFIVIANVALYFVQFGPRSQKKEADPLFNVKKA